MAESFHDISLMDTQVLLEYHEIKKLEKTIGEMRVPGKTKTVASMLYNSKFPYHSSCIGQ